jgi:hypothetical protein
MLDYMNEKLINGICGSKTGTEGREESRKTTKAKAETTKAFQEGATPPFYIEVDSTFEVKN